MNRPEITATIQTLIDLTLESWEQSREWPPHPRLATRLRREGFPYDPQNPGLWPFVRHGTPDTLELTLYGFAAATRGERFVRHFVPFVHRAIAHFLSDPHGNPVLTDEHFAELLAPEDDERFAEVGRTYFEALTPLGRAPISVGPGLKWSLPLAAGCLRYRNVRSAWDFYDLPRHGRAPAPTLRPEQRDMALWVLERWRIDEGAPDPIDVVLAHLGLPDPVSVWEEMPNGLFFQQRLDAPVFYPIELRAPLLLELGPNSNEDIERLRLVLHAAHDLYIAADGASPPIAAIAEASQVSEADVLKLLRIVAASLPRAGVKLSYHEGQRPEARVGTEIFCVADLRDTESMVRWLEEQDDRPTISTTDGLVPEIPPLPPPAEPRYDFFISHASEDKVDVARPLSVALTAMGCSVWYDEFSLRIGDSLRRSIEKGIAGSRFGVVIVSEQFLAKEWPARELDALTAIEIGGGNKVLPIWHGVTKEQILILAPLLADKFALNTRSSTISEIALALKNRLGALQAVLKQSNS